MGKQGVILMDFYFLFLSVISETTKMIQNQKGRGEVLKVLQLFVQNFWLHLELLGHFCSCVRDLKRQARVSLCSPV